MGFYRGISTGSGDFTPIFSLISSSPVASNITANFTNTTGATVPTGVNIWSGRDNCFPGVNNRAAYNGICIWIYLERFICSNIQLHSHQSC